MSHVYFFGYTLISNSRVSLFWTDSGRGLTLCVLLCSHIVAQMISSAGTASDGALLVPETLTRLISEDLIILSTQATGGRRYAPLNHPPSDLYLLCNHAISCGKWYDVVTFALFYFFPHFFSLVFRPS